MIGNAALDVVIGLVFVYLLYSLYATILMEIISSFLGLRARNLCYAIARMLKDEKKYDGKPLQRSISRLLTSIIQATGKATNLTNHSLYNKFFEQPSVKYLSSGGVSNKPSYLSPETFAKGIIDAIKVDDPDMSLLGRIEQGLTNPPDGEALLPRDSETRKHILSLLDDANNDLLKFKILLEQWYTDTMQRSIGWFKRSTQVILIALGFVLAITFNVDTIAIIKKLSKDEDARNQLVKLATDFSNENGALVESVRNNKGVLNDTITKQSVTALNSRLDSLKEIRASLREDIDNAQSILSTDWRISSKLHYDKISKNPIHKDSAEIKHVLSDETTIYVTVHKSIDRDIVKRILPDELKDGALKISTFRYKFRYALSSDHVLGYLLTVLMLSLGAPFWFDLLNKLVKLRTSIAGSAEQKGGSATAGSPASNREILNRVG